MIGTIADSGIVLLYILSYALTKSKRLLSCLVAMVLCSFALPTSNYIYDFSYINGGNEYYYFLLCSLIWATSISMIKCKDKYFLSSLAIMPSYFVVISCESFLYKNTGNYDFLYNNHEMIVFAINIIIIASVMAHRWRDAVASKLRRYNRHCDNHCDNIANNTQCDRGYT